MSNNQETNSIDERLVEIDKQKKNIDSALEIYEREVTPGLAHLRRILFSERKEEELEWSIFKNDILRDPTEEIVKKRLSNFGLPYLGIIKVQALAVISAIKRYNEKKEHAVRKYQRDNGSSSRR
ncbi:hypothetical protein [uncultured Roseibium sp.]|uniref:hypothetical protein n=1 Tax=uncultured Roseibium sp. TaxID=1936171 RepID=UPI0026020F13|nr:hypothetical protein [uncultured Roseibium sp.]